MENWKEVKGVAYEALPREGNITHDLQEIIINAKEYGLSVNAQRIMLQLSLILKNDQLAKKDINQLNLLDDLFDSKKNNQMMTEFHFKYSDFLPKGNKNYTGVKAGISELQKFNMKVKFSRLDNKGKLREYEIESTFISALIKEKTQGFIIAINYFWYRMLINITEKFNPFLKTILFNVSTSTSLSFYFFLKKFTYIEAKNKEKFVISGLVEGQNWRRKGIYKNLIDFLSLFGMEHLKYPSDIKRKLLDPIRDELNRYADISFNYKIDGKNILIIQYPVNHILISEEIEDFDINKIKNALKYKIKKQGLDLVTTNFMLELYLKFGYENVTNATRAKRNIRGLLGRNYIEMATKLTEDYIRKNNIDIDKIYNEKGEMRKKIKKMLLI